MLYKFKGKTFDWQTVTASGWGGLSYNERNADIIRKVNLQIVPNDPSKNWYPGTDVSATITEISICAYGMPMIEC